MRKSLGLALEGEPNVQLSIKTDAPILYWLIFDSNFDVVEKGDAANPKPFRLPVGDYLCEMKFGPAARDMTASMTIVTNCPSSPYEVHGEISNKPTATIDRSFSVC
ncbi:hypothetical protein [uncultured Erythrobacter sp.]|uniref:hypothetical protein n=1 Tax=uncultured Erythrobacter sp. TaxID=263913 RepID=UPI0026282DE3|nr:hypothetical protein [uncultured Erythrobacter sp.]